ncbi:hypothetical protein ETAA8_19330 [Anatilimnocola aggregata]|uniref:Uncharacterized protein n=2 Tax=Anatilimnocola aggregata TaxID=2528021 RepID=A0A517Y9D7_9BACT|nr:hypothetical protein ETAA8_19330 [Anatilimnocola aggregata]
MPYVNRHIEAVNSEYRELEQYSYELEKENSQLCDEVEQLREDNERLLRGEKPLRRPGPLGIIRSPESSSPRGSSSGRSGPDLSPPSVDIPAIEVPDASPAPSIQPPASMPAPAPTLPPRGIPPANFRSGAAGRSPSSNVSSQKPAENSLPLLPSAPKAPRHILDDAPPALEQSQPAELPPPPAQPSQVEPEPVDAKVTHLFLNPLLTRGANLDQIPGDDGLSLVFEPRNQSGQFVPHAGPVSIVVLDPTKEGDAARLARWDLDEQLASQRISRSSSARGIHLQLPWPGRVPESNQVKLFVRFETADGRKVEAQHELLLNPAAQASQRWTPRPGDRPRATITSTPIVSSPAAAAKPKATLSDVNPPLPAPAVQSDLTKVAPPPAAMPAPEMSALPQSQLIQEPGSQQPAMASKDQPGSESSSLLTPPPPRSSASPTAPAPATRPEWKPFR